MEETLTAISTALGTAFSDVAANVVQYLVIALPAAIGIVAVTLGVKIAIRFFKGVSNG